MSGWEYKEKGKCIRNTDEMHLTRVRDTKTFTEVLRIEIKAIDTDTNKVTTRASIDCDFLTWESEIKTIARYGIYFDISDKYKIRSIIKDNFADIPVYADDSKSKEIEGLFEMYCNFIQANLEDRTSSTAEGQDTSKDSEIVIVKDDLYGIALTAFDEHLKGCTSTISAKDLRNEFLAMGYIECNPMRTDKVIKDKNNKTVRCVAFKKALVDKSNSGIN